MPKERAGPLPDDVSESVVEEAGAFRGGLLFTPPDPAADAAILYFHGGGFVAGSPTSHRVRHRLAGEADWDARAVGALPPGAGASVPGPARRRGRRLRRPAGIGADRLILAGDSAGACVALWGLQGLDPERRTRVAGVALLYGGFGGIEGGSIARNGTAENGLDAATLSVMYRRLGPAAQDAWPLDFAGEIAVPAYVLAAELDAVFDDSALLFQRLGSRADSRFTVAAGQDHGFLKGAGRDPVALRELQALARWVKDRAA